jgi:hypothetical protein
MILSNSTGAIGDGSTSLIMTVTLTETGGVFAPDFVNPYSEGPGVCSDVPADECSIGAHFPDLVDGDNTASFGGLVVDITFSTTVPVTIDGFEFNLLGGGIQIDETLLPPPEEGWDLTVTDVTLSAVTLPPNGVLRVTATTENIGNLPSPAQVRIRVFRSADSIIEPTDIIMDDDTLEDPIQPGGSFTQFANMQVPGAGGVGTWWVGVCIITADGETDATNNCSDGTEILVTSDVDPGPGPGPGPADGWDLIITNVTLSALTLPPNGVLTVTATAENIGTAASPAQVRIQVFRSADATITPADFLMDDDTLENPIQPGGSFTQAANAQVPGAGGVGTWWIGVCIITTAGEADATNNCSDGTMIQVGITGAIFGNGFED